MTTWTEPECCQLCGNTDPRDLRFRLVHWKVSQPGMAYEHIQACHDYAACRSRVELAGKPWPVIENAERGSAA